MSRNWKDLVIMVAASAGVALLVAGAEASLPLLAASGVGVAMLATGAKLANRGQRVPPSDGGYATAPPRPVEHENHPVYH